MAEINISNQDLLDAENFLVEFLTEQVPEGQFAKGSALRDLAVKAVTYIFAYIKGEIDHISARQSLLRIGELGDEVDAAQAADELLSNWLLTRAAGRKAKMPVRLHFTQKTTMSLNTETVFWRTNDLAFYLDTDTNPYVIAQSQMLPVYDTRGILTDYVVDVPMVASRVGEEYSVAPGRFVGIESPVGIPYYSYAENIVDATPGAGIETTTQMIERAGTAISVRNLVNNRSCDSVLRDAFQSIISTLTLGVGDPEMMRDSLQNVLTHLNIHVGGHHDTYIETVLSSEEETGVIGGYFPRADNKVTVFRDPYLTRDLGTTFTGLGVAVGDVLNIRSGIKNSPMGYIIYEVSDHELYVGTTTPFTEAYDEFLDIDWTDPAHPDPALIYSIGHTPPSFDDIPVTPGPPVEYVRTARKSVVSPDERVGTSRYIKEAGSIFLPGRPVQDISLVEITDPLTADSILINPATSTILFPIRSNGTPIEVTEASLTQFQVHVLNPTYNQSALAVTKITVGPSGNETRFDGRTLRVVYRSLTDFDAIHAYVSDPNRRVADSNHLVRGRNPIWVEMIIPYRLKPTATDTFDVNDAAVDVAAFINSFSVDDDLDMSDIMTELRTKYPMLGTVFPFRIYYQLHAPDGQVAQFSTGDIVSIFDLEENDVVLENGSDLLAPPAMSPTVYIDTPSSLSSWYALYGISDRTVRYYTTASRITFVMQG